MPIELTADETKKFNEYLKEVGFENANPTEFIKSLNNESKTNREKAEQLQKDLDKTKKEMEESGKTLAELKKDKDERDKEAKRVADELAAEKKKTADAAKTLDERIADVKAELAQQTEKASTEQKAELAKLTKQLDDRDLKIAKRDQSSLLKAVKDAARAQGIRDTDVLDHIDLKGIKVEDGEPDPEGIAKLVADHKTAKPDWYKELTLTERDQFSRPTPQSRTSPVGNGKDFGALNDDDFERAESELRAVKV